MINVRQLFRTTSYDTVVFLDGVVARFEREWLAIEEKLMEALDASGVQLDSDTQSDHSESQEVDSVDM